MIADDEVHIWQIDLTLPQPPAWAASLDAAEQARAARFATAALQLAFRRAHGALRAVLAHYTGRAPAALAFVQGPYGKPALASGELQFNLTHSGTLALLAVAPTRTDRHRYRIAGAAQDRRRHAVRHGLPRQRKSSAAGPLGRSPAPRLHGTMDPQGGLP